MTPGTILYILVLLVIYFLLSKNTSSDSYLTKEQLQNTLLGSVLIHQSRSNPAKIYKIHYRRNFTFEIETIISGKTIGVTHGSFSIKENNKKQGYMIAKYDSVYPSKSAESNFHPDHKCTRHNNNSILTQWRLVKNASKRSTSYVIEYKDSCNDQTNVVINTLYGEP